MNIQTVKDLGNGYYLLNGAKFVPQLSENRDYQAIQKWIAEGNSILPQFTNAELLAKAKNAKKKAINEQRDTNKNANISYTISGTAYQFQRDILSQLAFVNAISSMNNTAVDNWITADNQIVDLTKADLISICNHLRVRDGTEHYQARKRKDAVEALTTRAAVNAYDITTVYE